MLHLSSKEALIGNQMSQAYMSLINSGAVECSGDIIKEEIMKSEPFQVDDPKSYSCGNCEYVISPHVNTEGSKDKWVCPSCCYRDNKYDKNVREFHESLKEGSTIMTYKKKDSRSANVLYIFLLDYSGSMCHTYKSGQEMDPQTASLIFAEMSVEQIEDYFKTMENQDTVLSRKKLMVNKVAESCEKLMKDPKNRIFIILFGKQISIMGNSLTPGDYFHVILKDVGFGSNSDEFKNYLQYGKGNAESYLRSDMKFDKKNFITKLMSYPENGSTPLGPALAVALGVAEQLKCAYTKLIIFTDGMANVGIGSMINEDCSKKTDPAKRKEENEKHAKQAKENFKKYFIPKALEVGAIIHFFTFIDEESGLWCFKDLAYETKGDMFQMDHQKEYEISDSLDVISKVQVTAIEAVLTIYASQEINITFCKEDNFVKQEDKYSNQSKSKAKKTLQNLMSNLRVGFHYDLNNYSFKLSTVDRITFQVQLDFFDFEKNASYKHIFNKTIDTRKGEELWNIREKIVDAQTMSIVLLKDNLEPSSSEVYKTIMNFKAPYPELKKDNNQIFSQDKDKYSDSDSDDDDDTTTITVMKQRKEKENQLFKK